MPLKTLQVVPPEDVEEGWRFKTETDLSQACKLINKMDEFMKYRFQYPGSSSVSPAYFYHVYNGLSDGGSYNTWDGSLDNIIDHVGSVMNPTLDSVSIKGGWRGGPPNKGYKLHRWELVVWVKVVRRDINHTIDDT